MLKRPVLVRVYTENYVWVDPESLDSFINSQSWLADWSHGVAKAEVVPTHTVWAYDKESDTRFQKTESIMIPEKSKLKSITIERSYNEQIELTEEKTIGDE